MTLIHRKETTSSLHCQQFYHWDAHILHDFFVLVCVFFFFFTFLSFVNFQSLRLLFWSIKGKNYESGIKT